MGSNEAQGHAGSSVTRSKAITRRRLIAFCLLMGWALFALSAIPQPLCHTVFGEGSVQVSPIHGAAVPMPCTGQSGETVLCEYVTAAEQGLPDVSIADQYRFDSSVDANGTSVMAASVPLRITSNSIPA